jgi:outer membrane immunogenic protein
MKSILFAAAATVATFSVAAPAAAQTAPSWTGFYAGGRVGYVASPLKTNQSVLFDKNLDGNFNDTVTTAAGANAFSPGFCNGTATAVRGPSACKTNNDGLDYAVHAGADYQLGRLVVGGLVEYGKANVEDSVTAFSTTPASYTLTREMRGTFGVRARVGYDLQGTLPYLTAGLVRAKVRSSFSTSNTANAFATRDGSSNANGYRVGGGFETRVGPIALGALYLYTNVKDDDFRVDVTRGTAGLTNPFILTNAGGTTFRRSDDRPKTHSASLTASYRF